LDEPAQLNARLQFRRAHQPDKPTFKQASPKEYDYDYTDLEVKRKFTNLAIGLLSRQGRLRLGEDILRVHEQSWLAYIDSFWA
jgi:hypothetical protein